MMLTRIESDMAGHCWFDMADANTLVLALIEVKFDKFYHTICHYLCHKIYLA